MGTQRKIRLQKLEVLSNIIPPSAKSFTAYDMNDGYGNLSYRGILFHPVDEKFIAYTIEGQGIYSSENGITWELEAPTAIGIFLYSMIYIPEWEMILGFDNDGVYYKIDGETWQNRALDGFIGAPYAVVYDNQNDRVLISGTVNELSYITKADIISGNDVTQLSSKPSGIIGNIIGLKRNGNRIIGCDANTSTMHYTDDGGVTWKSTTNPFNNNYELEYSSSLEIWSCVGTNGASFSLDNGATWQAGTITGTGWYGLLWEPTLKIFMAVSDTNSELISYSKDGKNYTTAYSDPNGDARGIAYNPIKKVFCAIGDTSTDTVMISTNNSDGVTYYG